MPNDYIDPHFRSFAQVLDRRIKSHGEMPEEDEAFIARQHTQVKRLDTLEEDFRRALIAHPWGPNVFKEFVGFICDIKRNILAARPFYRERQDVFTAEISKALQTRSHISLFKYHFNYQFILFAMKKKKWPRGSKVARVSRDITAAREELIEMNAPLAIAQASQFYKKTPRSHMTRMDLIQVAMEGLSSGVDKFSGAYDNDHYRQVLIGRIKGNLIEAYSETMIHFYPSDKRKLYNANKALRNKAGNEVDYKRVSSEVNASAKAQYRTTPDEIASLLAASSILSAESDKSDAQGALPGGDGSPRATIDRYADEPEHQPDMQYERIELRNVMFTAIQKLSILEQKVIKLRGVEFSG